MIAIAAVTPCPAIVAVAAPFMPISYIHTKIKSRTILVMNPPTIANGINFPPCEIFRAAHEYNQMKGYNNEVRI